MTKINKMEQNKIQKLAEDLWCDFADESDCWQTTMNYKSFIKAMHKALTIPVVVGQGEQLCGKCEKEKQLQILTDQAQDLDMGYD